MTEQQARTWMEVAMASIQSTMMGIEELHPAKERYVDVFCELEQAYARIVRAKKVLG